MSETPSDMVTVTVLAGRGATPVRISTTVFGSVEDLLMAHKAASDGDGPLSAVILADPVETWVIPWDQVVAVGFTRCVDVPADGMGEVVFGTATGGVNTVGCNCGKRGKASSGVQPVEWLVRSADGTELVFSGEADARSVQASDPGSQLFQRPTAVNDATLAAH